MTTVDNSSTQRYDGYETDGGNDTEDCIFLLSWAEVNTYFPDKDARKCGVTDYAVKNGALTLKRFEADGKPTVNWWFRSPGEYQYNASGADEFGSFNIFIVSNKSIGIRPAFRIGLSSGVF